jgi:hypothetical protein
MSALPWGVFDTVDRCWLGANDEGTGPRVHEDERVAMAVRMVYTARFQYPAGRLTLRRFMPEDAASVRGKDEVEPPLSYADAIARLGDPIEVEP